jgi:transposase
MDTKIKKVDTLPIIKHYIEELGIYDLFDTYVPNDRNFEIPPAQVLCVMVMNIVAAVKPLYHVDEWLTDYMDGRAELDEYAGKYNDDRLGRCLDALFDADRHSIMTQATGSAIKVYDLECKKIHNDSTSISFAGAHKGSGEGAVKIVHGYNKDGHPDYKQIVFGLNITEDGHVPLSYQLFDGNQADVTTHIPNWDGLRDFLCTEDFIYIGDSKVCSTDNMNHIAENGGQFITIMPKNRKEVKDFHERLKQGESIEWEVGYEKDSCKKGNRNIFRIYAGETSREGYQIVWVHSSSKENQDQKTRERRISKAEEKLSELAGKLNKYKLKTREQIEKAVATSTKGVREFLPTEIIEEKTVVTVKTSPGRPGLNSKYEEREHIHFNLQWHRDEKAIEQASGTNGIFPLITNAQLPPVEVLQTYKKQPFLEKRFHTKKSVLEVAPVFLNKSSRIEAMMFLYFIALMIVSLVERNIRKEMLAQEIEKIVISPKNLTTKTPTWNNIRHYFRNIHLSLITKGTEVLQLALKGLTTGHRQMLSLLKVPEKVYDNLRDEWWVFCFQ